MTDVIPMQTKLYRARRDLEHERAARQQAEDRVAEQIILTERAETLADNEKNRADGHEAHLHKVLVCHVIETNIGVLRGVSDGTDDHEVPENVLDDIAADLIDDLNHGLDVDRLPEIARTRLTDWGEEARG
ncbi:hypothetical protein [Glycomyces sp. NPDC048151]|uniref:hypothetical protein n=1 Tax=Glycomyces sp. NPDC048151 TaxID=3364002 RepID=UPI003720B1DF